MIKNLLFTLAFLFAATFIFAQITTVGIIGTATAGGWDEDTDMVQDAMNPDIWTLSTDLTTGEAKFRADDDWAINWGAEDFPTGTGTQDGPNIPVAGGPLDITFNSATGEYTFTSTAPTFGTIGILGSATPGGWDTDTDLTPDPNVPWVWTVEMTLTMGEAKFRADDDWTDNWGSTDWPSGVGVPGGDNIPVSPGDYKVTFNSASGEYDFELLIPVYGTVGIIGDATPGGWDTDTDMTPNPNDISQWSYNGTFTDGEAKFRAENDWAVNWGAADFPSGTGVQDGPNIPVVAGEYNVSFNSTTGEYNFGPPINIFSTVGIIGSGTGLGWDSDIDMVVDPANPDQWTVEVRLVDGELKFRAENDWAVNWGDDGFPTGTGVQDGPNIPVFAGDWEIAFNATTGVYSFTPVSIGIIGTSLAGGWDSDEDMDASTTVGNFWTTQKNLAEGEVKFRKNDDWAVNWGDPAFPTGIGTQDGPNIMVSPGGDYDISLNTATGEYVFTPVSSTTNVLTPSAVRVFPNPVSDNLNVIIEAAELREDVTLRVMDATGRMLETREYDSVSSLDIDVHGYTPGVYFLQISNGKYILGKRFTIAK